MMLTSCPTVNDFSELVITCDNIYNNIRKSAVPNGVTLGAADAIIMHHIPNGL